MHISYKTFTFYHLSFYYVCLESLPQFPNKRCVFNLKVPCSSLDLLSYICKAYKELKHQSANTL